VDCGNRSYCGFVGLIGIGVGIDYLFFVLIWFRSVLNFGKDMYDLIVEVVIIVGWSVLIVGVIVVIVVFGLCLIGFLYMYGVVFLVLLVVLVVVAVAVILLFVFFLYLGLWVNKFWLLIFGCNFDKGDGGLNLSVVRWVHGV